MTTLTRPRSRLSASRLAGGLLAGGVAALVVFHGGLLWQRLLDGSLFEPVVAARWGATGLLLAWLVVLRRAGVSLWRGERARTFWALVLLLHAVPAFAGERAAIAPDGSGLLLVLPAAAATGLLAASLPLIGARAAAGSPRPFNHQLAELAVPTRAPGLERCLAARAPPA